MIPKRERSERYLGAVQHGGAEARPPRRNEGLRVRIFSRASAPPPNVPTNLNIRGLKRAWTLFRANVWTVELAHFPEQA